MTKQTLPAAELIDKEKNITKRYNKMYNKNTKHQCLNDKFIEFSAHYIGKKTKPLEYGIANILY